jgi:hypothetical protein
MVFPEPTFLHQALATKGYRSAAVTAFPGYWLGVPELMGRLKEGFETFVAAGSFDEARGTHVVDRALEALDRFGSSRFFLWIVLLDAHEPYEGPAPEGIADGPVGRYLGDVARADREVGRFVDALAARGLLDRTLLTIHADHGEEFGEHGFTAHNSNLYEQQTHVPLLVRVPGLPTRRVPDTVSLVDFTPTMLTLLDAGTQGARTGRSLAPLLVGKRAPEGGVAYAEQIAYVPGSVPRRSVWLGSLKLIRRVDLPVVEVFDLAADPGERNNLLGLDPGRDARLLGLMSAWDEKMARQSAGTGSRAHAVLERFRQRTRDLVARIRSGGPETSAAFEQLNKSLVTPYLTIRPEALEALGTEGIAETLRQLVEVAPTIDGTALSCMLGASGLREFHPWLRSRWDQAPSERPKVAYGLAWFGDATAIEFFKPVFEDPRTLRPDLIAIPLGRMGDASGASWILEAVRAGGGDLLGVALPAAARIGSPALRRASVRRVRSERELPEGLGLVAVDALRLDPTDSATETLAALALSPWGSVSTVARRALAGRVPAAALQDEMAAARLEAEGLRLLQARHGGEAADVLLASVARSRLPRIETKLLAATALRLAGRIADAERTAADVEATAQDPADRRRASLARRGAADPVVLRADSLAARVEVVEKPGVIVADQCVRIRLAVTNVGNACWPGGPSPFGLWLDLARFGEDGARRAAPESFPYGVHWLPEGGLLPGETCTIDFVDAVPASPAGNRFVLTLQQHDGTPGGAPLLSW